MGVIQENIYCERHPEVVISRTDILGRWQYYPCYMCREAEEAYIKNKQEKIKEIIRKKEIKIKEKENERRK